MLSVLIYEYLKLFNNIKNPITSSDKNALKQIFFCSDADGVVSVIC